MKRIQKQYFLPYTINFILLLVLLSSTFFMACDHFSSTAKKVVAVDSTDTNAPNIASKGNDAAFALNAKPSDTVAYLTELSAKVVESLHNRDIIRVANFVHPDKGVLFVPSLSVDTDIDLNLKAGEIKKALSVNKEKVYEWGEMIEEEPILLTFSDYYQQYIYNKPYRNATKVNYNKVEANGAQRSNVKDVFPKAVVIEYFKAGDNPDFGGLDWGSLVTVFEFLPAQNQWFLVGLLHGQWTP
ncbi:MAG: hypothetical protein ACPGXL_06640 [Chitinophagales bacterium]